MQMKANRSRVEHLPHLMRVRVHAGFCERATLRVSVHGYRGLEREGVHVRCIRRGERGAPQRVCALLSVQSSRRQQGAPFQFTHQPRRWGVKARGIAVGDFTFEGRDYQSGDPCVEVMREGDCRGTVRGGWGDGGVLRGGGSTTQRHPGVRGLSFFFCWGAHSCQAAHLFDTRRCGTAVGGRPS